MDKDPVIITIQEYEPDVPALQKEEPIFVGFIESTKKSQDFTEFITQPFENDTMFMLQRWIESGKNNKLVIPGKSIFRLYSTQLNPPNVFIGNRPDRQFISERDLNSIRSPAPPGTAWEMKETQLGEESELSVFNPII